LVVRRGSADQEVVQVVGLEPDDRLRVRGLTWPAGYSALVPAWEVMAVNSAAWVMSA
jgi:hypothetical protein